MEASGQFADRRYGYGEANSEQAEAACASSPSGLSSAEVRSH